jgi:hypothetical protein
MYGMKTYGSLKTGTNSDPVTQHHIPEEQHSQLVQQITLISVSIQIQTTWKKVFIIPLCSGI